MIYSFNVSLLRHPANIFLEITATGCGYSNIHNILAAPLHMEIIINGLDSGVLGGVVGNLSTVFILKKNVLQLVLL